MQEDLYEVVEERIYSSIEMGKDLKEILLFVMEPLVERIDELEARVDIYG